MAKTKDYSYVKRRILKLKSALIYCLAVDLSLLLQLPVFPLIKAFSDD